jgi:Flp pilus assembly pilin Flp
MDSLITKLVDLPDHEEWTAMIEYSILLGMIAVAVVAMVVFVSGWITTHISGVH